MSEEKNMKYQKDSRQQKSATLINEGWSFIGSASPEGSDRIDDVVSLYRKGAKYALATNGLPIFAGEDKEGDKLILLIKKIVAPFGRPLASEGDPTEKRCITLRRSTWERLEGARHPRESLSACVDRLLNKGK